MNNKYKNSWKRIESLDIWSIPYTTPSSNWGEYIKCRDDIEASYQISEDLELIKKLVDKETPMKPKMVKLFGDDVTTCPGLNCGAGLWEDESIFHHSSYCGNCGQKIDWNVELEKKEEIK